MCTCAKFCRHLNILTNSVRILLKSVSFPLPLLSWESSLSSDFLKSRVSLTVEEREQALSFSLSPLLNPPLSPDLIEREGIKLIIVIFKGILNIFVMPYILFLYFAWRARVIDSDTSMNIYAWWATFPLFIIFWKSCLKYLIQHRFCYRRNRTVVLINFLFRDDCRFVNSC